MCKVEKVVENHEGGSFWPGGIGLAVTLVVIFLNIKFDIIPGNGSWWENILIVILGLIVSFVVQWLFTPLWEWGERKHDVDGGT